MKAILIVLVIMVVIGLIGGRIYLPYWVKNYVNRQIEKLDGYDGQISEIDIHLWRGAYQLHQLEIYKEKTGLKTPFFAAETVDISVEWGALFKGAIVAEIDLFNANLNFSRSQTGQGAGWARFVDDLSPLEIDRLEVHGGKVAYIDYNASPDVNIYIHRINAQVKNLRQITDRNNPLPSSIVISGASIGGGQLSITGAMNILQDTPDFDLDGKLRGASLTAFNDYARSFAAVEFKEGRIDLYSELAAARGKVKGYIKPVITDISVDALDKNPLQTLWRALASTFMAIFKNHPQDQFALRIPVEGDLDDPDKDVWSAFISIFQNAFGRAFTKNTDGSVSFDDAFVEGN